MKIIYVLLFCSLWMGCSKEKFLDEKPNQALLVPQTLEELQAILDNTLVFNGMQAAGGAGIVPVLGQTSSDDYFFGRPNLYGTMDVFIKNTYTWNKDDVFAGAGIVSDWSQSYQSIMKSNVVLDQLKKLSETERNSMIGKSIEGTALFHRAHLYYQLAQVFAPVYERELADEKPGLPLRLSSDVNEMLRFNTLKEVYSQILLDLQNASQLLPENSKYRTRPTLGAAYALLARIYLSMSDYPNSLKYVDLALENHNSLIDYNNLDSTASYPFQKDNEEVIFNCLMSLGGGIITAFNSNFASVDSMVVNSYADGDLRKAIFFKPRTQALSKGMEFKGSYFGSVSIFAGLAIDELYLIKAECLTRQNHTLEACETLNFLLKNRFIPSEFQPIDMGDSENLLRVVLDERRKELLFRGVRWTDLRRLNLDSRFAVTLKRNIGGEWFELPPNDPRYTYPIPATVTGFHTKMPQNPR